ncbi:MAG: DUF3108 domain-containing protein [Bacteroidales bacterium]|nr:DUF3108 domain-containing protein [Bacteroidales bacterium]
MKTKLEKWKNNLFIKRLLIVLIISGMYYPADAQCKPVIQAFQNGEELYYDVVYNWGFIWVNAGKVKFKVQKENFRGQVVYHFTGTGKSLEKYDWMYRVRDYYHSWATITDLKPLKYIRNTSEGKQKTYNVYEFDYQKNKIYTDTWNTQKAQKFDTLNLQNCLFDIMTAVYYVRTLDLSKYKINEKIPISMIIDNEIYNLYGRYLGKETLETHEGKKYETLKFSILLVEGTIFKGGEDLLVWVTADKNRVPILVDAKILVGTVKASFKHAVNLKYPLKFKKIE